MSTEPDEIIKVIRNLFVSQLGLKQDQAVLYNQRFDIPTDDRMYLSLGFLGARTFGAQNNIRDNPETGDLEEVQCVNRLELYSLDIYSNGPVARERNWEIPLVFSCNAAQQSMEAHSYLISKLPTAMTDISGQDGAARINRYNLTFNAQVAYQKVKVIEYFNKFSTAKLLVNP